MKASFRKYTLQFIRPAGTSRGEYLTKDSWFIEVVGGDKTGIGECPILKGLSVDDKPGFEEQLALVCEQINLGNSEIDLEQFPSIRFGLETALLDLKSGGNRMVFDSDFTRGSKGIVTNGLIWIGESAYLWSQIDEKLSKGFSCIKMKIGSLRWDDEKGIIEGLRKRYSEASLSIRVDANGAYNLETAKTIMDELSRLKVHSIEQPIEAGKWDDMAELCALSLVPVALDEELIGVFPKDKQESLLDTIKPHYLIIKPGLLGGFAQSEQWIRLAEERGIGWWATSALESNIGLNAIAQWVSTKKNLLPQGLGTGMLYSNNIPSPLTMKGESLFYDLEHQWDIHLLFDETTTV